MIEISVEIYPTEDKEKVSTALKNLFPKINFLEEENKFIGKSKDITDLDYIKQRIKSKNIEKTVIKLFEKDKTLSLNKQTAFIGKLNFLDEEFTPPLGCIELKINFSIEEFKKWIEE